MRVHKLIGMRLFSKMEMRRNRVLKKMDEQVSAQNKKSRIRAAQLNTFGNHLDQCGRQHESCPKRNEVAKVRPLPISLDDNGAAEYVCTRRGQAQQQTG